MIDESSGNGGRSVGSADSAAVRVLWFYSLAIVVIALSQMIFKFRDPKVSLHASGVQKISLNFDLASLSTILSVSVSAPARRACGESEFL